MKQLPPVRSKGLLPVAGRFGSPRPPRSLYGLYDDGLECPSNFYPAMGTSRPRRGFRLVVRVIVPEASSLTTASSVGWRPAEGTADRNLMLAALGVVYGDIGTSPLYAVRQSLLAFQDTSEPAILGALSLIIWSLVLVVTVKYVIFIMRADNRGEG